MSWDADLSAKGVHSGKFYCMGEFNYTHNTSKMIYAALDRAGDPRKGRWYSILDEMSGAEANTFLSNLLVYLSEDRPFYVAMNPENGWGDYDGLVQILIEMRDLSRDFPFAVWSCSG